MPGLNKINATYGSNKNTLLMFETNFYDSKSSFASWCQTKGVKYGAIAKSEGGADFNVKLKNGSAGNPKYLIHPDSTFEKVINVQAALDAANVSKDPIGGDDDVDPVVSLMTDHDGKEYIAGETVQIGWNASDNKGVTGIKLEYYDGSWQEITSLDGSKVNYDWSTLEKAIDECQIRVTATDAANNSATATSGKFMLKVVIDTTDPSPDLLSFTSMYPICDEFGSTIDTSDGFATDEMVSADFTIAASDSAKDEWTWGSIISELPKGSTLNNTKHIKVTYASNENMSLILQDPELSKTGESFKTTLAKSANPKTVVLKLDANTFKKPEWSSNAASLDLTKVTAIAFETAAPYGGAEYSIRIEEIVLYGYEGAITPILSEKIKGSTSVQCQVVKNRVELMLSSAQEGRLSILAPNGKAIYTSPQRVFTAGANSLRLPTNLAEGVYFTLFQSGTEQIVTRFIID